MKSARKKNEDVVKVRSYPVCKAKKKVSYQRMLLCYTVYYQIIYDAHQGHYRVNYLDVLLTRFIVYSFEEKLAHFPFHTKTIKSLKMNETQTFSFLNLNRQVIVLHV